MVHVWWKNITTEIVLTYHVQCAMFWWWASICLFQMLITGRSVCAKSLFLSKAFALHLWHFSPVIYAKHALVFPIWSWRMMRIDVPCKYCKKRREKKSMGQNAEVCEMTNRKEWKSCSNDVTMNVFRNIFLYFKIIRRKTRQTQSGKSCQNTTKGMFLLIYKFFA